MKNQVTHIRGKHGKIIALLERRILKGDYQFGLMPTERQLADELGVSRVTLRKSLDHLAERHLVVRQDNGRLLATTGGRGATLQIAYLAPAYASAAYEVDRQVLELCARDAQMRVRPVEYVHWDDPVINETLHGFDGVFLQPSSDPMPESLIALLTSDRNCPVIALEHDLSHLGIRSVVPWPDRSVDFILDYLYARGHRKIGCFNTQPHETLCEHRINRWRQWMSAHQLEAPLISRPVPSYENTMNQSYNEMTRILKDSAHSDVTVWFCITGLAAYGAIRAAHDLGIRPGSDLSFCTVDGEGLHHFHIPSLTCVERPVIKSLLMQCLNWIQKGARPEDWRGALELAPDKFTLFPGESVVTIAA